jgi:hypothetical protein
MEVIACLEVMYVQQKRKPFFGRVNSTDGTFQFKKIFEGEKAKNVTEGYILTLVSS